MKLNGAQGTYHSVPQNAQSEDVESPKKAASEDSAVENGPSILKTQTSPSKEQPDDINPEDEKKPMSPLRKFCFVLSLLQCILFIVAFGWLIPCKIPRHTDTSQLSHNWEYHFYGQDIITNLALSSHSHKPVVLAFGYSSVNNASFSGVRAMNVFDGTVLWDQNIPGLPGSIVCNGVDPIKDNVQYCIVTNNLGQMLALDIKNGEIIWSMHQHQPESTVHPQQISSAIIGKGCDDHSLPYVYAAVKDHNGLFFFLTVSSETGQIKEILNMTECVTMPENIMFRNIHADDTAEAPLELVMTCANKEGSGMVYTIIVAELCDNRTFQSVTQIAYKLAISEKNEYPMNLKAIGTAKGDDLVGLTHDGKIQIFSDDSQVHSQYTSTGGTKLKDFSVGHFTNNSLANIAFASKANLSNASMLTLLDSSLRDSIWKMPLENGTIESMYTVTKAFNSVDGILLKIISRVDDDEIESLNTTDHAPDMVHFEEKYAVLECSETGALKAVSIEYLSEKCQETECYPKILNDKPTAVVADVDQDGLDELVLFTRKTFGSSLEQSITIKLVRLSEFIPSKVCSSPCHCS